jgi:stage V sporulation protein G
MEITEIRVSLQDEEVLKAFVSITLDNEFVIRGLKVIESSEGHRFVAMPARRKRDGTFQDIAHPINRESREYLERAVFAAYEEELGRVADLPVEDPASTCRPPRAATDGPSR